MADQPAQENSSIANRENMGPEESPAQHTQDEQITKPKRKVSAILIALIAVGVLLAACIVFCVGVQYYPLLVEKIMVSQFIDKPAPDFTLTTLEGREVTLGQLQGKPVVINFWATWCPSCVKELPDMQTFYGKHGDEMHLLAISVDSSESDVRDYVEEKDLKLPVLHDTDGDVGNLYHIRGIPATIFVNSEGIVISRHIGSLNVNKLEEYLESLKQSEETSEEKN